MWDHGHIHPALCKRGKVVAFMFGRIQKNDKGALHEKNGMHHHVPCVTNSA